MKRWIACGVAAGLVGSSGAAEPVPVSVYPQAPATTLPGTVVPAPAPAARPDVSRPLSSVLDTIPPAAKPSVPAYPTAPTTTAPAPAGMPGYTTMPTPGYMPLAAPGDCGAAGCATAARGTCLQRLRNYFAWRQGPAVIPACTPEPYHPPLRHYFPTTSAPPGSNVGGGSSDGGAAGGGCDFFGPRFLHFARAGGGLLPGGAGGAGGRRCDPCNESLLQKACAAVTHRQFGDRSYRHGCPATVSECAAGGCGAGGVAGSVAPAVGGIYPGTQGGYRFASPVFVPPAPAITASGGSPVGSGGGVGSGLGGVSTPGSGAGGFGPGGGGTGAGAGAGGR